jgi:hypothetical protein
MGVMTLSLMTFIKMDLLSILNLSSLYKTCIFLPMSAQKNRFFRNRCQQEPTHHCQAREDTEAELPDSSMDLDTNLKHEPACRKVLPLEKNQTQIQI